MDKGGRGVPDPTRGDDTDDDDDDSDNDSDVMQ